MVIQFFPLKSDYQTVSLKVPPSLRVPPSDLARSAGKFFLLRKSLIKNFAKDTPPLRFWPKSRKGGTFSETV